MSRDPELYEFVREIQSDVKRLIREVSALKAVSRVWGAVTGFLAGLAVSVFNLIYK
jgi:hypothetical protein